MQNKYLYSFCMLLLIGALVVCGTILIQQGQKKEKKEEADLTVVTSFYPMYIAVENLTEGTKGITLKNLSEPETGCLHDFQLTPGDMKLLSTADVFIVNGSGAESFLQDVIKAYPKLTTVDATAGIDGISEDVGMHAWMSPGLYEKEIKAISKALKKLCPEEKALISGNEKAYLSSLQDLENRVKEDAKALKKAGISHVILFSEAYEGLCDDLGLRVTYLLDLDEERQVSSGEVAEVIKAVQEHPEAFIIAEAPYGEDMANTVKEQTGTRVVFFDTLTRGDYQKNRYLDGMKKNLDAMEEIIYEAD